MVYTAYTFKNIFKYEENDVYWGGITAETAAGLAQAGADFLAVSAGVWAYPAGPGAAVEAFNTAMAAGVALRS